MRSHRPISEGMPLLRWGEEVRARVAERRRRCHLLAAILSSSVAILFPALWHPRPFLIWNMTASAPIGLYILSPASGLRRGDIVAARLPAHMGALADSRHYLPSGLPMIKAIAALPPDRICASGRQILINGSPVAVRLAVDGRGRSLPVWTGCRRLGDKDLLLLATQNPGSFDGRYFGSSREADLIGRATLIWRG